MKSIKLFFLSIILICNLTVFAQVPQRAGWWKFDNPENPLKAEIGNPLSVTGELKSVTGPSPNNYAVKIATKSYLKINSLLSGNANETKIEEYTILIDFAIPDAGVWHAFLQTNPSNEGDADLFSRTNGQIGVSSSGYSEKMVASQTWYRMVVTVKNDEFYRIYINNELWLNSPGQGKNGRFSLSDQFLLFADDNGEDGVILCSEVAYWTTALNKDQVNSLGGSPGPWSADRSKVGWWKFDDPENSIKAEKGNSLEIFGSTRPVAGPTYANNAIEIEKGSYLRIKNVIPDAADNELINTYSIMLDFSIKEEGIWHAFFQTDPTNNNDAELFGNSGGCLGVSATSYSTNTIHSETWYRMVVSVKNDEFYRIYINGELWLNSPGRGINGVYSLSDQLLLFADDNGEDGTIYCSEAAVWGVALTEQEVKDLGTIAIPPSVAPVKVNLTGPKNIRLGAPNRYTVSLENITSSRTEPFIAAITITDQIMFKQFEIPNSKGIEILPIDSTGSKSDHTELFYIPYLEGNEKYSFDVIVIGVNEGMKSLTSTPSFTVTGLGKFAAKEKLQDIIAGWFNKWSDLNDKEGKEYAKGMGLAVEQLEMKKEKEGIGAFSFKTVVKYAVREASKVNPATAIIYKIGDGIETISKVKDSLRRRIWHWLYKETGLYDGNEPEVVSGKTIDGKLVASSDPNEKYGPAGFGNSNFISEANVMTYTIRFENKKEATAPAYRVQIYDTLSSVFDVETVNFGNTSHSSPDYKWVMKREGNVLHWDIEGIELAPNITPPEGEGYVTFSVKLKSDVDDVMKIENKATIIFDINKPITTNTWQNILDMTAPTTVMSRIQHNEGDSVVVINCQSTDNVNGSGVGQYYFYASKDDEPFDYLGGSFVPSFNYTINNSKLSSYRFYAISADNAGNIETKIPQYAVFKNVVSSDRIEIKSGFTKIFPNPVNELLSIELNVENDKLIKYYICSLTGQILMQDQIITDKNGYNRFDIDLSFLERGFYLVNVMVDNNKQTYRFVKE